ncbi:MAG: hypothetical protein JRD89_14315 [Deltaproteobacteria bacterium]|nr:hypothetical protein [Deltaproteobacteria bacterium]
MNAITKNEELLNELAVKIQRQLSAGPMPYRTIHNQVMEEYGISKHTAGEVLGVLIRRRNILLKENPSKSERARVGVLYLPQHLEEAVKMHYELLRNVPIKIRQASKKRHRNNVSKVREAIKEGYREPAEIVKRTGLHEHTVRRILGEIYLKT